MYIIVMLLLSCHLCFQTCLLVIFVNGHSYLCVYMCTKPKTVLPTLSQYRTELGENTFKYATSFSGIINRRIWNFQSEQFSWSVWLLFKARNYPSTNICGGNSYLGNWVPNKKWLALQTTSWKWTTWPPYSACKKENTTSVAAIINVESHRRLSSVRTTKQVPGRLAPACCSCLPSWSEGVWWVTTVNYVLSPENNLGVL